MIQLEMMIMHSLIKMGDEMQLFID